MREIMIAHKLYQTVVATYDPATRTVTLNSGGRLTATTKRHINQFAADLGLDFTVYGAGGTRKAPVWYVAPKGNVDVSMPFEDGMTFHV
jgi:hypothetical protein